MIISLGHSTFPAEDFIGACKTAGVDIIVDTRSHPGSAKFPYYNKAAMRQWLPGAGIMYEWWPALGGWRDWHEPLARHLDEYDVDVGIYCNNAFPKQRIAKKKPIGEDNTGFTNYGFFDYQFYMAMPEFMHAVDALIARGLPEPFGLQWDFGVGDTPPVKQQGVPSMACICCEACWTRCHRSMIADYLGWRGLEMFHVVPRFRKVKLPRTVAKLQPHSSVMRERLKRYHPRVIEAWELHRDGLPSVLFPDSTGYVGLDKRYSVPWDVDLQSETRTMGWG